MTQGVSYESKYSALEGPPFWARSVCLNKLRRGLSKAPMHMIKTALPRWAASLAAAAVIVANRSKKEDKDYCDEDSPQRFGRALFTVAVIILLMSGDMSLQNLSIGPGNIAANHQDESFPIIVVDESKVITLSAGSYCANLFRYQALPTGMGDVTPVVLLATGSGSG